MDLGAPSLIERYRPALFVLGSQVAAATLNAAARLIETRPEPVHPFQILLVRMLITGIGCTWYLCHVGFSMSNCLSGTLDVRGLVALRAIGGICGTTGFFFSMIYLSLSEATALNFLGPLGSLILTKYLAFAEVNLVDCLGAAGAFIGVVLVVQPENIFGTENIERNVSDKTKRLFSGLIFSVLGIFGGIITLTSIRRIGTRIHPLMSVNMFAWSLVAVSLLALLVVPEIIWPRSIFVWACLIYIGICGFAMEFLLTLGISNDSSSTATLMIHSQIIWALALDCALFKVAVNSWAIFGTAIIIGSLSLITIAGKSRKPESVVYADSRHEDEAREILSLDELHANEID